MTAAVAPAPSMFAVFRRRDFSILWLAQLISTAGSALTDIAAGIWVYRETGSTLAVAFTLMATAIPNLVVGLVAGVFVDRHDRKKVILITVLLQAIVVGFIAAMVEFHSVFGLYALLLLNAGLKTFFDPAYSSIVPELASDEELTAANAFLSIAEFGSTAIGFAGAGILASIDLTWAFIIDALSFLVCAGLISLMGSYPVDEPEEKATVGLVLENLREGIRTLWTTPIIRSLFISGAFMFVAFGLWNVLLLPFSIQELHATEFEYGLQEGLTSFGFVIGSFAMARFGRLLPEPAWIVVSLVGMGIAGILYATSTSVPLAILWVTLSGFLQPPSSVSRSVLLQRNIPRDLRGRVFSAYFVLRDILFLVGMIGAGLADFVDIRVLIIVASSLLFVSAGYTLVAPGLSIAGWRAAAARLRAAPTLAELPTRPATPADLDRLVGRLATFSRLSPEQRAAFLKDAVVIDVPGGTKVVEHGAAASTAYFVLEGSATAGIPVEGGDYRGLSTMGPGEFFGEIAALTGSSRTADVMTDAATELLEVPAAALRATMAVPEIERLVLSTMTSRLGRTEQSDLPRLAGPDQQALRDLRTARPAVEATPSTSAGEGAS